MSKTKNNPSEELIDILEWFEDSFEKADKFFEKYQDKKSKKRFKKIQEKLNEYAASVTITQRLSVFDEEKGESPDKESENNTGPEIDGSTVD